MRDPILNITLSRFKEITNEFLTDQQVVTIFEEASKINPAAFLVKTNKRNVTKVHKVLRESDTDLFNIMLYRERLNLHHICNPIQTFDKDFAILKEVAADAEEFCDLYSLDRASGYDYYIKTGMRFIGKNYYITKFQYYKAKIYEHKRRELVIANDQDPELTERLYKLFCRLYYIRPTNEYREAHIIDFVFIADRVRESGLKYDKYIQAQAEFYKQINKTPEPSYFHTQEALERAYKYKR